MRKNIIKDNIAILRQVEEFDLDFLINLRNHQETRRYLLNQSLISVEQQKKWYSSLSQKVNCAYLIFELRIEKKFHRIGLAKISNIDLINNSVEIGADIDILYRGKGYSKLMYQYIFLYCKTYFNSKIFWLQVLESNVIAINLYKKLNFIFDESNNTTVYINNKPQKILFMKKIIDNF